MKYSNFVIFLALCLTACGSPEISDSTDKPWLSSASRDFMLTIDRPFLTSVDAVRLRYTRHYWPDVDKANEGKVIEDDAVSDGWQASGKDLVTAPKSHHVFYQWAVDYTRPFGLGSGTITSEHDFVIGCTPEMIDTQLQDMQQAVIAAHDRPDPVNSTSTPYLPHGFVSIDRMGVGFAFVTNALGQSLGYPTSLDPVAPSLVLYRPRPKKAFGESDAQYLDAITDEAGNDPPYELIGWAYGGAYEPSNRPLFGCIPSSKWFVHEAGFHRANGAMDFYPTNEAVPGQSAVGTLLPPVGAPQSSDVTFWHPRVWDLHVWLVDGSNTPVVQIFSPAPVLGINGEGFFFYPETFQ